MRGIEQATPELLDAVRQKGRTIVIAEQGSEELRYLQWSKANANVGGPDLTHIILLPDARKIEVLEEFLHGTQQKRGLIARVGLVLAERHVKEFMLQHRHLLGISAADAETLRNMLGDS